MLSLLVALCVASLIVQKAAAFNCSILPIYVDIHKRIVHGTDVFQYGSFIGLGSPAQNQSLFPSLRSNETSVASAEFCKHSDLVNCGQSTRGNFDPPQSSTWVQENNHVSADEVQVASNSTFGQDALHMYTHYFEADPASERVLRNFSTELAINGSVSPGVLGLGQSSTVLQKLFDDGLIAGRTNSLYVGSGMDRAGGVINGSNTFGGYDAGRFTGDVHSYAMNITAADPLGVVITNIILDDPTGLVRNVSLFNVTKFPRLRASDASFEAKITTDQYPMSFPYEITQNFIDTLAAVESDNPDRSLKLTKPFNGTMTIVLSDGFAVTLPNEVVRNASDLSPVAAQDQESTEPFYLSLAWLSQVYLMMDYDSYTFHLAQAVPEDTYVIPKTFCPRTTPVPYSPPSKATFRDTGMIGAVIGGVIGGLALLSVAVALLVLLRRRKARRRQESEDARAIEKLKHFDFGPDNGSDLWRKERPKRWWTMFR